MSRVSTASTGSRGMLDSIKKVAVTMSGQQALFMELNQNIPLNAIIQDISQRWGLTSPDDFALQFSEPSGQTYITEKSRGEIKNGNVLQLTDSPAKAARTIIEKLKTGSREDKVSSLQRLSIIANDATFAQEFKKDGLKLIIDSVMAGDKGFLGDPLAYLLKSFVALMDHDIMSWDDLQPQFIKQVCECISGAKAAGTGCIQPALDILESVILRCEVDTLPKTVEEHMTPDKVIQFIQSSSSDVQKSAIALLNAMFLKSSVDKRKKISDCCQSRQFRNIITSSVLRNSSNVGPEMACQLSKLQRLMLNLYEQRMKEVVNPHDSSQVNIVKHSIEELRKTAFDFSDMGDQNTPASRKSHVSKDFKKLGFTDQENTIADFEHSPPGLLALDNMIFFSQTYKENYIKVVLENSGRADKHDCPFVQASIRLTQILCDFLKIGEAPHEEEHFYYPMFFCVDKPMEEFFSECIQLLNKTWKDMRATKEDFSKVLTVVKEQIIRALDSKQLPPNIEKFRQNLNNCSYEHLKQIWESERLRIEEKEAQTRPIRELRDMLMPEVMELITKHRLNYLEGGTRFPKYDAKGNRTRNRYQYWRLAPNHKALHYGDCTESGDPTIEQLQNKVPILEIKQILVGKDCLNVARTRRFQSDFCFAIVVETANPEEKDATFFFSLSTDQEYAYHVWVDGINALLNKPVTSQQAAKDCETLLNMEIKLQLLETEGIQIPENPPTIPPLPDNFDFAYTIS